MDQVIKKGNSILVFLRRNLKVSNESTKIAAYLSLVRPLLEHCCTVWSSYTQEHVNKLEMVQRRTARHVTNRYHNTSSVTSMLEHLEWESLEARHIKCQLTMMFKIINSLVFKVPPPSNRKQGPGPVSNTSLHKNQVTSPLQVQTDPGIK